MTVHQGEIVCIAGIEGNGQTELIYALTGIEKIQSGSAVLHHMDTFRFRHMDKNGVEKPLSGFSRIAKDNIEHVFRVSNEAIKAFFINSFHHFVRLFDAKKPYVAYEKHEFFSPKPETSIYWKEVHERNRIVRANRHERLKSKFHKGYEPKLQTMFKQDESLRYVDAHLEDMAITARCCSPPES